MAGGRRALRPVRPSLGLEAEYRRRLRAMVARMQRSVMHWVEMAYRAREGDIAQDASPAAAISAIIRRLTRYWLKKFSDMAPKLADYFSQSVFTRSEAALKQILRDGGISVPFTMTRSMQNVLTATVQSNVSLIRSIPKQHMQQVETLVMQSVQAGRDLATLKKALQKQFGVTDRRAALIARDQNNKATSMLTRARQVDLGITEAVWMHSHAGLEPRPEHVKMNGKTYDIRKGMWDPKEKKFVLPGELINCRCTSRPVLPGLEAA